LKHFKENLGLCRRAGALITGFDAVVEAAKRKKLSGIMLARDVSEKTQKEIKFHAGKYNIKVVALSASMDEIKAVTGKRTGVLAVTDDGLFTLLNKQTL